MPKIIIKIKDAFRFLPYDVNIELILSAECKNETDLYRKTY